MLTAIAQAEPVARAIELETTRRLAEAHPGMLADGTLYDRAKAAVASEARDQVIRDETRRLNAKRRQVAPFVDRARRKGETPEQFAERERAYERRYLEAEAKLRIAMAEGRKQAEVDRLRAELRGIKAERRGAPTLIESAMPKAEDVRRLARQRAGGTVLQFLRPDVFWAAEARASRAAIAAAAKGDFEGAILAKRQELWARAMFRELATARDDVRARTDALRQLTTKAAQERIGKRGGGHLAQIFGLLDQYGLAPVPEKILAERAPLDEWLLD